MKLYGSADETAQMRRLIRVFARRTYQAVPFTVSHLTYCLYYYYTSVCGEPVVPMGYKLYSIASRTYGSLVLVICDFCCVPSHILFILLLYFSMRRTSRAYGLQT